MELLIVRHAIAFERDRHRWRDDGASLGALLAACLLEGGGNLPIEMKKNAVACVAFDGPLRTGRASLKWLATPRMLRGIRHD
jgi:phosphohistidine phosphatase SixA